DRASCPEKRVRSSRSRIHAATGRCVLSNATSADNDRVFHVRSRRNRRIEIRNDSGSFQRMRRDAGEYAHQQGRIGPIVKEEMSYDAIVVGSGITGGWAAKELTEKGLKTLVLEAGRPISPEQDYVEHVPAWEMKFRGMRDRRMQLADQPIQSTCYACD